MAINPKFIALASIDARNIFIFSFQNFSETSGSQRDREHEVTQISNDNVVPFVTYYNLTHENTKSIIKSDRKELQGW